MKTITGTFVYLERLKNTQSGNPMHLCAILDDSGKAHTFTNRPNSSTAYGLREYQGRRVRVELKTGRGARDYLATIEEIGG